MQVTQVPSTRRLVPRHVGDSARARSAVIARSKQLLKQDFQEWPGTGPWYKPSESVVRTQLWNKPSGAGARDVHTFRGVQQGRLLLGRGRQQVAIKKGKTGLTNNGVGMKVVLKDIVEEATLSYRFSFSKDYDWTLGGKLPGLSSTRFPDGGRSVGGWSNRLMWRTFTNDPPNVETARMCSYRYYPGQPKTHGEDITFKYQNNPNKGAVFKLKSGRSYQVSLYIKLNDVGETNGVQKVWIDGRLVVDENDLVYRTSADEDEKIGGLHWHIYHGGSNTPAWIPNKNQNIWFDDVEIREGLCVCVQEG